MKVLLLPLVFLYSIGSLFAQNITITGTVTDGQNPIEFASVYLNGTTLGTETDEKGKFRLDVPEGNHQLVVSYLGYKTLGYPLNTGQYSKALSLTLEPSDIELSEVVVQDNREYYMQLFRESFIGRGGFGNFCTIINPNVIQFQYDGDTRRLTVTSIKPIQVRNKALGYDIFYDLSYFKRDARSVEYLIYSRFQPLEGRNRKQKKWKKNRTIAYHGSRMHFFRAVLAQKAEEEGFIIHQFERKKNPNRPTEKEVLEAKKYLRSHTGHIQFSSNITQPQNAQDSAMWILHRAKNLPEFVDYLYQSDVPDSTLISIQNNHIFLEFENNLSVVYTKEKEEEVFINRNIFEKPRPPVYQTTSILPIRIPTLMDKRGVLVHPLDIFIEGYWSYEKQAYALPLDYEP